MGRLGAANKSGRASGGASGANQGAAAVGGAGGVGGADVYRIRLPLRFTMDIVLELKVQ